MEQTVIGVVGCGAISSVYLQTMVNRFGDALRVKGCCSRNGVSAMCRAEEFGIQAMTLEKMLLDPEIEILVNLTPVYAHGEIIRRGLLAGKHIYTEKTLAAGLEEAGELISLAARQKRCLCCAPDTILSAGIQTARAALSQGLIGTLTSCQMTMNRDYGRLYKKLPFLLEPGAGCAMDVGPYFLSCASYLLGSICEVAGMSDISRPARKDADGRDYTLHNENRSMALLRFESGVVGTLHLNMDSGGPEEPLCTIFGTEGVLKIHTPNRFCDRVELLRDTAIDLPLQEGYTELLRGVGVAEMASALRENRLAVLEASAAVHVQETIGAIYESQRTGQCQKIESRLPDSFRVPFRKETMI